MKIINEFDKKRNKTVYIEKKEQFNPLELKEEKIGFDIDIDDIK